MAYEYLTPARDQLFLMPVCMRDWLSEGHLALFVIDVVARLDTSALDVLHPNDGPGRPAYDPEMMCTLLLYSYMSGVRSSRRIEQACGTDAAFRVICGGLCPDHSTIARFISGQERPLEGLFVEGLRLCHAAGLVDLAVLALDGTKIAADASLAKNRSGEWIREQVKALMAATVSSEQDQAPAPDPLQGLEGVEPVAQISTPGGRLGRLQAALEVIEAEEKRVQDEAEAKAQTAFLEAEQGRKVRGRKPTKDPAARLARARADHAAALTRAKAKLAERASSQAKQQHSDANPSADPEQDPTVRNAAQALAAAQKAAAEQPAKPLQANITDPDSRIMKTRKGWVQGYNAQAIVNEHQIVLACKVTQDANDQELYQPMINELNTTLTQAGIAPEQIELILADAGYCSETNLTAEGPDRLIATQKDHKQRQAARKLGTTTGEPPEHATPLEAMEHRLRTKDGAAAYAKRGHLIEPIFGNQKHNRGYRSFRRRGQPAAQSEWALMHLAGNLKKLYDHQHTTA